MAAAPKAKKRSSWTTDREVAAAAFALSSARHQPVGANRMVVDTGKVSGRREVRYANYDEHLKAAIARCGEETRRADHPVFGRLTLDEWEQFGLRHAEMHMSFVHPE
ncbi:MAG: DUF1569 domain-containing protein [Planctomycetota bacterium]|nr:MAG: DUF1569 domain-containing protein [Planctomycetota bacterium]REK27149.1 MAG: DUF1569 domain-containing protein [Planctomycetota bacterium]REK37855.1 MAG: DUF1569 domain-containing protein [Planctomycetota bacterium]